MGLTEHEFVLPKNVLSECKFPSMLLESKAYLGHYFYNIQQHMHNVHDRKEFNVGNLLLVKHVINSELLLSSFSTGEHLMRE